MRKMSMRERILAVVQGAPLDRVPFVMYDGILPTQEVQKFLGRERIGLLRWSRIHRVEHPHCTFEVETFYRDGRKWERRTLHTPKGSIYEERAFEGGYGSSSIRKHYIQEPEDYEVFWAYLEDSIILENYAQYERDLAELGGDGFPLVAVERTPYQQLWVQWVGLDTLGYHLADYPDRVQRTIELLSHRAQQIFELAYRSSVPFVDFPDNITAPAIGPARFRQYCVPFYNRLAEMLAERGALVFVHMDGDIKPLWQAIGESKIGGIDSFAPAPDNDTTVAEAIAMWPQMRLFINFPSSVHLRPPEQIRAEAEAILKAGGHSGRIQIQISENVPLNVWRTSLPVIAEAIEAFGPP